MFVKEILSRTIRRANQEIPAFGLSRSSRCPTHLPNLQGDPFGLKIGDKCKMGKIESKEKIHWVNDVEKAVLIAGLTRKPVFLMILKSFCPTCKALEPEYVQDKDFRVLSKFFVMARSTDQKQVEETYAVDGHYVPRILFLDSKGAAMEQFFNESSQKTETKYFYPQAEEVVNTMRNVLYHFYSYTKTEN